MSHNKSSGLYVFVLLLIAVFSTPVAYSANWNPLPDTGVKTCFDSEGIMVCPSEFEPFYGQDAQYASMAQESYFDNGNGTVTDENTGLLWQSEVQGNKDWNESTAYCNQLDFAGHTDWRLPEIFEWISIITYSRYQPIFHPLFGIHASQRHWSSTPLADDGSQAWYVDTNGGNIRYLGGSEKGSTKCVRGENKNPGIYVSNGDSVTDTSTFLTWQQAYAYGGEQRDWEQALAYCESLTLDSNSDWRLPNAKELLSLVDYTSVNPSINETYFSGDGGALWTSTPDVLGRPVQVVFGKGQSGANSPDSSGYARCVRDGLLRHPHLSVTLAGTGEGNVQGETVPGGVSIIDCGGSCSNDLPYAKVVRLTATSEQGSSFVRWAGDFVGTEDCEGDSGVCTLQMFEDTLVVAYFMPRMQLTVTKDGSGEGFVLSSPVGIFCGDNTPGNDCDDIYKFGTEVTLMATPASGSSFWYWSGEDCSGNGDCIVNMDRARSVTATFRLNFIGLYLLEATKSGTGRGNVTSFPEGIDCGSGDCANGFPIDSKVTLTASSEPGSIFSGWQGYPCFGSFPTCEVTMEHAWTQDAKFTVDTAAPRQLTVTIRDSALGHSGSVKSKPRGIDCGTDCTESYPYNEKVTLIATPDSDAAFVGWTGACGGTDSCTLTMNTTWQVTANFGPPSFNKSLTVTKDGNGLGTVTSSLEGIDCGTDCSEIYPQNTAITLIATPAVGRNFLGWNGGGCSGTGDCQITLLSNTTVNATFEMDPAMEAVFEDGFETE